MTVSELQAKLKELGFDVPIVMLTGVWTKKRVKRLHGYSRSSMKQIPEPKNPNEIWCGGCGKFNFAGLPACLRKRRKKSAWFLCRWIKSGAQSGAQ
jgi:hypothetical protein